MTELHAQGIVRGVEIDLYYQEIRGWDRGEGRLKLFVESVGGTSSFGSGVRRANQWEHRQRTDV